MPQSKKEINRYQQDYKNANYDTIKILTPKGTRERLKAEAARRDLQSVNALLNLLIAQILPPDSDEAVTAPEPSGQIPEDAERETAAPTEPED